MMWKLTDFGEQTALIDEGGNRFHYRWLSNRCDDLLKNFTGERSLVFHFCSNTPGSLIGYVAFLRGHITPIMLDAELDRDLLNLLLERYRPSWLWMPESTASQYPDCERVGADLGYVLLKTPFADPYPLHDDLALLLTTSGSTGSPKLVRQSYANIAANTQAIVDYLGLNSAERAITTLPMHYTYGLSIINSHLAVGASIILTQKTLMQREFWRAFGDYGATTFGGVPYTYEMLDRLRFFRMNLPTLRTMTQAGGRLSPELHRKFAQFAEESGRRFFVMYGQTEATARMAYLPSEKSVEKCGSMGIAVPGGRFKLMREDGVEIKRSGVSGELIYEGPNVTMGYAERGEDLAKGDERHGVLATGDMAKFDDDGYYYIVGRKKRFLKIYGSRVNLDETERMIRSAFGQLECACAGTDDQMSVFLVDGSKSDDIHRFLAETTGLYHKVFKMVVVPEIPKNSVGKTLYSELEKQIAQQ